MLLRGVIGDLRLGEIAVGEGFKGGWRLSLIWVLIRGQSSNAGWIKGLVFVRYVMTTCRNIEWV